MGGCAIPLRFTLLVTPSWAPNVLGLRTSVGQAFVHPEALELSKNNVSKNWFISLMEKVSYQARLRIQGNPRCASLAVGPFFFLKLGNGGGWGLAISYYQRLFCPKI